MQVNNQSLNYWTQKLEVAITVVWLLCFLDVRLPAPIPGLVKALSYPIIAILVILRWKRFPYVATRDVPLLIYIGIAVASILWTADAQKTADSIRGLIRMFLLGAFIATRFKIEEQVKIFATTFAIAAVLSFVTSIAVPSYGVFDGAWVGIFTYKNYMGYTMSIAAVIFLLFANFKQKKQNWIAWIGFGIALSLNWFSRSAGSFVNILMLLSLVPLYRLVRQNYKLQVFLLGTICILLGTVAIFILGNMETIVVDILGKNLEFNGRTPIWNLAIEKGLDKPFLGYGLNGFWSSDAGIYIMINTWAGLREDGFNSHNSFLELFLNLGLFGILMFLISLIRTFAQLFILLVKTKKIDFFIFTQILLFMCLAGWADTNFLMSASSSYCCIYVTIAISSALELERIKRNNTFNKSLVIVSKNRNFKSIY
ncbi:MAG: O-antigen ligase family protein [Calothrix sp. C42_A2020_038]|nr:O-antigen ligase family protein [Calothrix sp. C42_A2020_038]